jgi:hypothetical protein
MNIDLTDDQVFDFLSKKLTILQIDIKYNENAPTWLVQMGKIKSLTRAVEVIVNRKFNEPE